jgi:putative hydrolase
MHPLIRTCQSISLQHIPAVDGHMHTSWTDGQHTAEEMHAAAVKAGLKYILFSEHARKTSGDWFYKFAAEVRALPKDKCCSFVGVETKIDDFDGSLDISDEIRANCDLVMGSVHRFPSEREKHKLDAREFAIDEAIDMEFRLSVAAIRTRKIDILGHPFGMTYRRFRATPPFSLIEALAVECANHRVAFEINARYHDSPWDLVKLCKKHGTLIALGSNAHMTSEVGAITAKLKGMRPE